MSYRLLLHQAAQSWIQGEKISLYQRARGSDSYWVKNHPCLRGETNFQRFHLAEYRGVGLVSLVKKVLLSNGHHSQRLVACQFLGGQTSYKVPCSNGLALSHMEMKHLARYLSHESACSWQPLLSMIRETLPPEGSCASRYVQPYSAGVCSSSLTLRFWKEASQVGS